MNKNAVNQIIDNYALFDGIVDEVKNQISQVLQRKGQEYSMGGDRFSNFKTAARIANLTPEKALMGMKLKHTVSIMDIVDKLDKGTLPTKALLDEKIGDEINYLILLKGLLVERIRTNE